MNSLQKPLLVGFSILTFGLSICRSSAASVEMVWSAAGSAGQEKALKSWSADDLRGFKPQASDREKESATGSKVVSWKGPLLSALIDKALEELPLEQRSQVDLVIFKNRAGQQAMVPRWLLKKYPVLLGMSSDSSVRVVLPVTSKPKIREEGLPLQKYNLSDIVRVDLASYHQVYADLFLKKRTDPLAIRGEKLVVENCTGCHASADLMKDSHTRSLASSGHPATPDAPRLKDRDVRALASYLEALRSEKTPSKN